MPTTAKEQQNFLGVMNFYRRFLPSAANTHRPLTEVLRGGLRPNAPLEWTKEMRAAFKAAKVALTAATRLAFPTLYCRFFSLSFLKCQVEVGPGDIPNGNF